jgi:hypothetical protein
LIAPFALLDPLRCRVALIVEGDDVLGRPRQVADNKAETRVKFLRMPLDLGHDGRSLARYAVFGALFGERLEKPAHPVPIVCSPAHGTRRKFWGRNISLKSSFDRKVARSACRSICDPRA